MINYEATRAQFKRYVKEERLLSLDDQGFCYSPSNIPGVYIDKCWFKDTKVVDPFSEIIHTMIYRGDNYSTYVINLWDSIFTNQPHEYEITSSKGPFENACAFSNGNYTCWIAPISDEQILIGFKSSVVDIELVARVSFNIEVLYSALDNEVVDYLPYCLMFHTPPYLPIPQPCEWLDDDLIKMYIDHHNELFSNMLNQIESDCPDPTDIRDGVYRPYPGGVMSPKYVGNFWVIHKGNRTHLITVIRVSDGYCQYGQFESSMDFPSTTIRVTLTTYQADEYVGQYGAGTIRPDEIDTEGLANCYTINISEDSNPKAELVNSISRYYDNLEDDVPEFLKTLLSNIG